jgi:malonyl-CoA/methylmalonyl-CoA synthetase
VNPEAPEPRSLDAWTRHLGRPVKPGELLRELASGTLTSVAADSARRFPDRAAICIGDRVLTHGELYERSSRVAGWLAGNRVARGDRVLLAGPTSIDFITAYLGTLHAGATATFANPMLTAVELTQLVESTSPFVAFCDGDRAATLVALEDASTIRSVVVLEGDRDNSLQAVAAGGSPIATAGPNSKDVAHLAFTSGTTGPPRAAPLTHANVLASVRAVMLAWRWQESDVLIHSLPLTHGHGLSGLHAVLVSGGRGVFLPAFDPARLVSAVRDHAGTVLFAVPAIWERLLGWDGFADADLSSLRLATSGSAPLPPAIFEAVREVLGHPPLERYGCTETGYTLSNPFEGARKPGKVGFALPGAEVRVVDGDGRPVDDGSDGEIVVRGPQVFAGSGGEADDDVFLPGGWFRTGDIGRVDPDDGYVSITGRTKELIITGGLNVYPREVEFALQSQPEVAAAAVVGVPSKRWGEEVTAFIVPATGGDIEIEQLIERLRTELAPYKCPKRTYIVDELPRNQMGKVLRAELVARVSQDDRERITMPTVTSTEPADEGE